MGTENGWSSGAWSGGGWGSTKNSWGAGDWSSQNSWHGDAVDSPAEKISVTPSDDSSKESGTVREEMARLRSEASKASATVDDAGAGTVFAVSSNEPMDEACSTLPSVQGSSWPPSGGSEVARQEADVQESNQIWSSEAKSQSWGSWPTSAGGGRGSSCDDGQESQSKAGNTSTGEGYDSHAGGEAREEDVRHEGSAAARDEAEGARDEEAKAGDDEKAACSREEDVGEKDEERSEEHEDGEAAQQEEWEESQTAAARRRQLERMKAEEESKNVEEEIQKDWHQKWLRRQQQHSQPIRVVESLPGVTAPPRPEKIEPGGDASADGAADVAEGGAESGAEESSGNHADIESSPKDGSTPAGAEHIEDPRLREEWYQKWLQRKKDRPTKMIEIGLDAGTYTAADLEGQWGAAIEGQATSAASKPSASASVACASLGSPAPSNGWSQGGWGQSSWTGSTWSSQEASGRGGHEWYRQWLKDAKKKPGPPPREMQRAAGW